MVLRHKELCVPISNTIVQQVIENLWIEGKKIVVEPEDNPYFMSSTKAALFNPEFRPESHLVVHLLLHQCMGQTSFSVLCLKCLCFLKSMWEIGGFKLSRGRSHFLIFKVKSGQHKKSSYCAVTTQPGIGSTEGADYCWGFLVQLEETGTSFSRCRQFKTTVTGQSVGIVVMMVFLHP